MEQTLRPARPVSPGRILRQELEVRGWTQRDLAAILGRPEQMVSEIINGAKQITPDTSLDLAQAFGVSPEFWYTLESNYRLDLARRQDRDDAVARRSQLYARFPLAEMARRHWLTLAESADALEAEINRFFGFDVVSSPETRVLAARLRCSNVRGPAPYAQFAWLRRAQYLASQQRVGEWQPAHLQPLVAELLTLARSPEDTARVPEVLARWGVRTVVLRHLGKTYLDGAAFYVDDQPCVAVTLRYDRIDAFWFTLLHEIGHLAAEDRMSFLDVLDDSHARVDTSVEAPAEFDGREISADQMAAQWLLPADAFQRFVAATGPHFSGVSIETFGVSQSRHPGIVLGRLQREGLVPYSHLRPLLVKVTPYLTDYVQP